MSIADELAALVHEVGNADRKHGQFDSGDTLSFAIWCREMDKAKIALANHVLDQWGPILSALRTEEAPADVDRRERFYSSGMIEGRDWFFDHDERPTTEPELVERVARALRDKSYPEGHALHWQRWPGGKAYWFGLARAALSALPSREAMRWQPIETFAEPTALSSGCGVLIAAADGEVGEAYYRNFDDDDAGWWWANTTWGDYPEPDRPTLPTHWMPLPLPPVDGGEGM